MPTTTIPESPEEIDFTDLELKYQTEKEIAYDAVVCCDFLPVVDEAKKPKLIKVREYDGRFSTKYSETLISKKFLCQWEMMKNLRY